MLDFIQAQNVLFLDIETAPACPQLSEAPQEMQALWEKKAAHIRKESETIAETYERAGIYAEFGKIICISVGVIFFREGEKWFRVKSFYSDDEKSILEEFSRMLTGYARKEIQLCAHNGKEFDFPYIARRMLIHGLKMPALLDVAGKKPWEVPFLDTLELWKFGDYKHYTSLELLTYLFHIPSPKTDLDGSMIGAVYWKEHDLTRIARYCEGDVLAVAQLFLCYQGQSLIDLTNVELVRQE
jgi:DNA polymerase elongation subunit (family B)